MKYSKFFLSVLITLALVSVSAQALASDDQYVILDVEGIGNDRASAMDSAWLEGIRQAAGSFIDSKTELNNDQITERIISYSRGLVEKYEILSVDDSRAGEGLYKLKMRMWIVRDILRDGAKHATANSDEVSFSASDLKKSQKDDIDANALEARNVAAETAQRKAQTAPELLEAMLGRYKPEDFLSFYISGKPEAVKGKQDTFKINVEISFNEKLYSEAFIPDLKQVLDQIAKSKKDVTLTKQREELRSLKSKQGLPLADTSIICRESGLDNEYKLAVYDRPNRFGCRLYSFSQEDEEKILGAHGVFDQFCGRTNRISGIILELLDDNKEVIDTVQVDIVLPFLVSNNILQYRHWAIHPSILKYEAMFCFLPLYKESFSVNIPLTFEMPEEFLEDVKSVKASLRINDEFAKSGVITRLALNNSAYAFFKGEAKNWEEFLKSEAEKGYLLAKIATESINAYKTIVTPNLLIDEFIYRVSPFVTNGITDAAYRIARVLESNHKNYQYKNEIVYYYSVAAKTDPAAMIRLGEIYEQGFYGVQPDAEKANTYYTEGLRLLFMLSHHGHPLSIYNLARAAIEGLGMKQDTQLAEQCFKITRDNGYDDPEFWVWENYGITVKRVCMSSEMKKVFKFNDKFDDQPLLNINSAVRSATRATFDNMSWNASNEPDTCLLLIREKLPVIYTYRTGMFTGLVNITSDTFFSILRKDNTTTWLDFIGLNKREKSTIWDDVLRVKKKEKK